MDWKLVKEKRIKTTQACFAVAANARTDRELSPGTFKYIANAEFVSKYTKFMNRWYKGKLNTITEGLQSGDGHLDTDNGHIRR